MFADLDTFIHNLHQSLASCSKFIEESDYTNSNQSVADVVALLDSASAHLAESENDDAEAISIQIVTQLQHYLHSPSLTQEVVDALAFEVPKAVARFAHVSARTSALVENVVDCFVQRCTPRDMLSILCEALGSPSKQFLVPCYFIPLLTGLRKVLMLIQRRHYEQIKTAIPVILDVLKTVAFESGNEDVDCEELFHKAIDVGRCIWEVCLKLESSDQHKLRALLGLYILQIMALVSDGMGNVICECLPLVLELSNFLRHCELSYIGLITGSDVDRISNLVIDDGSDECMDCFSQVKHGAVLAVIWGYMTSEVAVAAHADLSAVIMELQGNWTTRCEAITMMRHVFMSYSLSWELKKYAVRFLVCVMDGIVSPYDNDNLDCSEKVPALYSCLQAITVVIMYASDTVLRKDAFSAFKKVLADIPSFSRFDILEGLITNSESPSMIGILLDLVKDEMRKEGSERNSSSNSVLDNNTHVCTPFWSPPVLKFVEVVLRPPKGGPPSLPEYSDAVLAALNLFRFILISEATGNSNRTGVLSKESLQKAYKEWLLPLRTLISGTVAENRENDRDELTCDTMCAFNPVELVLYRCIELVEEKLKTL